jgi:hypothetical protein
MVGLNSLSFWERVGKRALRVASISYASLPQPFSQGEATKFN